jgi:hypothetical protein
MFGQSKTCIEPVYKPFKALFLGNLEVIGTLQDKSFKELAEATLAALDNNHFKDAFDYAGALRYLFGVPGLIVTHQVYLKSFVEREKEGEYLETAVCNALINLLLAEQLLKQDSQAVAALRHHLPQENNGEPDYFQKKKAELLRFCDLPTDTLTFCEQSALDLASECLLSKTL